MGMNDETICIDFDGVLHRYSRGYEDGTIYDVPMPDAVYATHKLADKGYNLVVLTARSPAQFDDIEVWLAAHGFPPMEVTNLKVPAFMYLDDRAIRFVSWQDAMKYAP